MEQTKKLKKLQVKWYKKLAKSGFKDIEQDEQRLKSWSESNFTRNDRKEQINPTVINAKLDYYAMCRQFLCNYKFKSKREQKIFEMHSEGLGIRVIAVNLKTYKDLVHKTLKKLIKEMRGK